MTLPAAASAQWEGLSVDSPEAREVFLVLISGIRYGFDGEGPATASLVYSGGVARVNSDPNAAGALQLFRSPGGRIHYYQPD